MPAACIADKSTDNPATLRAGSLRGGVMVLLVLTVVQRGVGFLRGVLFCRWLSPEQLGQWDMAFNFLMLAAPLAVFGLPGSFGRYSEHFRQRGQLRTFLRRATLVCAALAAAAAILVIVAREACADLVFGTAVDAALMWPLAGALFAVVGYNFFLSLCTALRQYRLVSAIQFVNTVAFAALGVLLMTFWEADTLSVVIAFGIASLLAAIVPLRSLARIYRELPAANEPLPQPEFWQKLMPFAVALWFTNWLSNAFEITDRFLLIHYSGLDADAALALVGQYHSARLLPVLLLGVAELLTHIVTPHLTADWEAGRRDEVSRRLNFILKLFGLAMAGFSTVVMIVAPALFDVAFLGKFQAGEHILRWTLACATWSCLAMVMYNYLWCAERSRLITFMLFGGLAVNVTLNMLLIPHYGLVGSVVATAATKLLCLTVVWRMSCRMGLTADMGLVMVALLPLAPLLGAWIGAACLAALLWLSWRGRGCFTAEETNLLHSRFADLRDRLAPEKRAPA